MSTTTFPTRSSRALCTDCGMPLDARHFDESGLGTPPSRTGPDLVLASFELQPQYCGVLEYFSQFSDAFATDNSQVQTPNLHWLILVNDRPLYPYLDIDYILNPWGYGSFPFRVRLDEATTIQFVVRWVNDASGGPGIVNPTKLGGRIAGRYWYNPAYGDVGRSGY
jgi:hypothetical protein